ncbi:RNA polymerase sigma-70 factor [Mucilaginibacter paludis]|uniref:RNA polymerase, sigma-24 subunit, ECF subfamily n=1 Tax=Mucilaginibacter paludis DSM 18603 TaxID=714943 RepID=H1YE20_9SPHI|nr:RNA polymerase sigma-70 factor [Mucilaginibacter paludis]EHQ25198.1 RNA polymerase, sigma-24 subunit, ECF subfamily [Mucilaginibacter paludis DSM 18603]
MLDVTSIADAELVVLLKEGHRAAFSEIYARYQGLLYIYACKIVKDEDEAEDIVQDIFIYLWSKHSQIQFNSSLSAYLYSAVRYKFFDLLDRKKVRVDYAESLGKFLDTGVAITDEYIREKELANLIEKEIARLPAKMREVFELSRKAHLSHREIAQKLNLSEKTVKNQVNNSLKELRFKLGLFSILLFLFK